MGCISGNLHFLNKKDIETAKKINTEILFLLNNFYKNDNNDSNNVNDCYKGILYGSFIKTIQNEIKVIEFNSRLGDPEAVPILSLLKNDLHTIFYINYSSKT